MDRWKAESPPHDAALTRARQMRLIVDWLNPVLSRQHAAGPVGSSLRSLLSVSRTSRSIFSSPISRGAPGRGSSPSPAMPSAIKRLRQRPTVNPVVRNFAATAALLDPPAHARTILARKAPIAAARLPRNTLQLDPLRRAHHQLMLLRASTKSLHTSARTPPYMQSIYDSGD